MAHLGTASHGQNWGRPSDETSLASAAAAACLREQRLEAPSVHRLREDPQLSSENRDPYIIHLNGGKSHGSTGQNVSFKEPWRRRAACSTI